MFSWIDCIPNNLVFTKPAACGFDKNMLCYIYSHLKSKKQCFIINNIKSIFEEIIWGILQESFVGPILFNILFKIVYKRQTSDTSRVTMSDNE